MGDTLTITSRTSLRENWNFVYTGQEVLEAAQEKADHHAHRLEHYIAKRDGTQEKLENRGVKLEVRHHSGGADVKATADSDLAEEFNHLQNKVEKHEEKLDEYQRWARVLERNTDEELRLTARDIEFFGL